MNKIVCDVCGTSYPETAAQCPICGNAKSESAAQTGDTAAQDTGYAYVRGGRFSHANVKKRNSGKKDLPRKAAPAKPVKEKPIKEKKVKEKPIKEKKVKEKPEKEQKRTPVQQEQPAAQPTMDPLVPEPLPPVREPAAATPPRRRAPRKERKENNIFLLIIVILLVLAIVAVCVYICMRLLDINFNLGQPSGTTTSQTDPTTSSSKPLPVRIPCAEVRVQVPSYTFSSVGQTLLLSVNKTPADTTDPVVFASSDPYIASVDEEGKIVAVADGSVTITITCGQASTSCEITCRVGVEPEYPPKPTEPKPTESTTQSTAPFVKLELNRTDFTLFEFGQTHNLYSGTLDPAAITWTSSNEEIATVTNGIVKAVGNGWAVITAEYQGQKVTCDVHCSGIVKGTFVLSTQDRTIVVGESFVLRAYLADENGEFILDEDGQKIRIDPSELKFYVEDAEGFISVDENGKVTGLQRNYNHKEKYKYVFVEYNGVVLKCIVRVKDAPTTENA